LLPPEVVNAGTCAATIFVRITFCCHYFLIEPETCVAWSVLLKQITEVFDVDVAAYQFRRQSSLLSVTWDWFLVVPVCIRLANFSSAYS
jgi:hypothetical protein